MSAEDAGKSEEPPAPSKKEQVEGPPSPSRPRHRWITTKNILLTGLAVFVVGIVLSLVFWFWPDGNGEPAVWIDEPIIQGAPVIPPNECTRLVKGGSREIERGKLTAFMRPDYAGGRWKLQEQVHFIGSNDDWQVNIEFQPCDALFITTFTLCVGLYGLERNKMEVKTEFDEPPDASTAVCAKSPKYVVRLPTNCDIGCKILKVLAHPAVAAPLAAVAGVITTALLNRWLSRRGAGRSP